MHVEPEGLKYAWDPAPYGTLAPRVRAEVDQLATEIPDTLIEAQKPGNRGLLLSELQGILGRCADGDPMDPRWDELRLRCLKEMARLLRVYEPQAPSGRDAGADPRILRAQVARDWDALEAKARGD